MGSNVLVVDMIVVAAFYLYIGAVVMALDNKLADLRNRLWRSHSIITPLLILLVWVIWPLRSLGYMLLERHVNRLKNTKPF